jgi:peptidoglycan/xylan/chitin deacetylase (PgdA/CDA1 family)
VTPDEVRGGRHREIRPLRRGVRFPVKASLLGKRALSSVLHSSGLLGKMLKDAAREGLLILMYHRVVDGAVARSLGQEGMYVDVETFDNHLRFLKRRFLVIPLEEGLGFLERGTGGRARDGRPLCAITFDDGWRDLYENAYPLLRSHGMSATAFLATGFIGTRNWFWTDRLARLLRAKRPERGDAGMSPPTGVTLEAAGIPVKPDGRELGGIVEAMKRLRQEEIERILQAMSEEGGRDPASAERAFLTWEEVGDMYRSGVVRFGSHTESHRILTTLTDDEVAAELHLSMERLVAEGVVDPAFVPFAYPNGNHTDRIAAMAARAGYRLAVTTQRGWNRPGPAPCAYQLKRIGVHQDIASTDAMLCCRVAEIF